MSIDAIRGMAATVQPLDPQLSAGREQVRFVVVGHVDHGKSTLIGRMLYDTNSLPEGKLNALHQSAGRRGKTIEWAFLLDALQAERDQGITIDTSQIWFRTGRRDYVIIDAPGHKEFLKNMVSGAATSDAALLMIDAKEGIREQTRRHGYLLHMLGVKQIIVAINKMDLVDYSESRFREICKDYSNYLASIGVEATHYVPIVARDGDNIAQGSSAMAWYSGPTVLRALDGFAPVTQPTHLPLRMPVQEVYKFDDRRIIAGRIETGMLRRGDRVLFSPSNKVARIASIEAWNAEVPVEGRAGQSVGITLDEQIFVERGEVLSHLENPPIESSVFRATIFWLGRTPLTLGKAFQIKLNTSQFVATVQSIEKVIDTSDLSTRAADSVERNAVAEVVLRARGVVAFDEYRASAKTGRFVVIEDYDIAGGGIISMDGYADQRRLSSVRSTNITAVAHKVTAESRAQRNGHTGAVLWLTGLSGAGKSTIAMELERRLFQKGCQVYVLDGDNVRHGLNADLGFSPEDRAENIRRIGEVAGLFANAGMIVISAFISPYRTDRDRARGAAKNQFHEVYVHAELSTCEARDPKGLYRKARRGEINDFTGISSPYEPPDAPEVIVSTERQSVDECVESLLGYIERSVFVS